MESNFYINGSTRMESGAETRSNQVQIYEDGKFIENEKKTDFYHPDVLGQLAKIILKFCNFPFTHST